MTTTELAFEESTSISLNRAFPLLLGVILLVLFGLYGGIAEERFARQQTAYLMQPMANDFYIVDYNKFAADNAPRFQYGILKVASVDDERLEMAMSRVAYSKFEGAKKDLNNVAYSDMYYQELMITDSEKLQQLRESGAIQEIIRF